MARTVRNELADELGDKAADLAGPLERASELDDQAAYHVHEAIDHLEYAMTTLSPEASAFDGE